jgi:hypothetical protein
VPSVGTRKRANNRPQTINSAHRLVDGSLIFKARSERAL